MYFYFNISMMIYIKYYILKNRFFKLSMDSILSEWDFLGTCRSNYVKVFKILNYT